MNFTTYPSSTPQAPALGIVTVATNRYLQYWREMAMSADQLLAPGSHLSFYVFTDQPNEAQRFAEGLTRSEVIPVSIPNFGWPEATLRRYEIFRESWNRVQENVVIHLDADMIVSSATYLDPPPARWPDGIAFVRHPGFRRPPHRSRMRMYLESPRYLKGDITSWRRHGALGSWETNPRSNAYVPKSERSVYVCGGVWMGLREPLGQMINVLADRTNEDREGGVMAVWHDESHLNWYASLHGHYLFDSEKCFAPGYENLSDIQPEIIAVDKGLNRTR